MAPISWSDISYYRNQVSLLWSANFCWMFSVECLCSNFASTLWWQILPLIQKYKVVHLNRTDSRLANNGQPLEIQKLRCRVNFSALRFTPQIEELGRKVVKMLREGGPFLVLHLRYEMDMLAFSGCTQGCNSEEVDELTRMRQMYYTLLQPFCL